MYLARVSEVLSFMNKTKQIYNLKCLYNKPKNIVKNSE